MSSSLISKIASNLSMEEILDMPYVTIKYDLDGQRIHLLRKSMGLGVFIGDDTSYFSFKEIEDEINRQKPTVA